MSQNNNKLPTPRDRTIKLNNRKAAQEQSAYRNSDNTPIYCSCTLSTYERKGVIAVKYIDTFTRVDNQYQNKNTIITPILEYNQYVEALHSLRHNCEFILLASKFNKEGSNTSLQDLKNLTYDYPKTILSSCTHNSISHTIYIEDLDTTVLSVLRNSVSIIEKLENKIDFEYLSKNIKNFEELHKKNLKLQQGLSTTAKKFIQTFESGKVSLTGLKQAVNAQETPFSI